MIINEKKNLKKDIWFGSIHGKRHKNLLELAL